MYFEANGLTPGMVYRLCMDQDGITQEKHYTDTFHTLYLLDISLETPGIIRSANQEMVFTCADCIAGATMMYLTSNTYCDESVLNGVNAANSPVTTDAVVVTAGTGTNTGKLIAVVDASGLTSGTHYYVCVDRDGTTETNPYGYTQLQIYVTGGTVMADTMVEADFYQTFTIICDGCSSSSVAFLSSKTTGCDVTVNDAS